METQIRFLMNFQFKNEWKTTNIPRQWRAEIRESLRSNLGKLFRSLLTWLFRRPKISSMKKFYIHLSFLLKKGTLETFTRKTLTNTFRNPWELFWKEGIMRQ